MEVNKEEAIRCLSIAQRHRSSSNLPSALKFARKSVSLYTTPEGQAMITIIEREIESGGSGSSSTPNGSASTAKASGVEEHVTSAHARPGHPASTAATGAGEKAKKREYTPKQLEVVKRVKGCKHHEYYEILAVERSCEENEVKRAYKKLALALHPDKNGAPGADEAFKMVSKAFQVLSDGNLRAAFDSNPHADPTQRNSGMSSRGGGGGMHPGFTNGGFQGDINPEDLFNMFFGGGNMGGGFGGGQANVFTFGGPGGFRAQTRRRATNEPETPASPLVALLPLFILFAFALLSILPSLLSGSAVPDPEYAFEATGKHAMRRNTWHWGVQYHVNRAEWENSAIWQSVPEDRRTRTDAAMSSSKLRSFERDVESVYVRKLQNECEYFNSAIQQSIGEAAGFFGIGADYDKIRELRGRKSPSCEQLRTWGLRQTRTQSY